jgi:hypothetical protein
MLKNNSNGVSASSGLLVFTLDLIATIIVNEAKTNPDKEIEAPIKFETISMFVVLLTTVKSNIDK